MQMNEKVLAALEVLKDCAENDFERHRIDVLIKDLTDPPKVEIIDVWHQKFNGVNYRVNNDGHYQKNGLLLHREVFQYYYGEIPEGFVVHHLNENPSDNSPANLQAMTHEEHSRFHMLNFQDMKQTCKYCGKLFIRSSLHDCFCSLECRKSYKKHTKTKYNKICKNCGKVFQTTNKDATFCSRKCVYELHHKLSTVTKICPICGKEFTIPKSRNQKTCSLSCGTKYGNAKKN